MDPGAHYWLSEGDLLVTRSNTPELVGHAAIYSGSPSPCVYPDLMMRLAVDVARSSVAFVHLFLQGRTARDFIRRNAKGTSPTMKKINQGTVMSIPFPVSTSPHRQAIAVDRLRELTAVHDRVVEQVRVAEARASHLLSSSLAAEFSGLRRGSAEDRHQISG
jgi:type I restriction enzyme S subunit